MVTDVAAVGVGRAVGATSKGVAVVLNVRLAVVADVVQGVKSVPVDALHNSSSARHHSNSTALALP